MSEFDSLCRSCFTFFDHDGDGKVKASQLKTMLRMLGQVWSNSSFLEAERVCVNGYVSFQAFLKLAKQKRALEMKALKTRQPDEATLRRWRLGNDKRLTLDDIQELKVCFDVLDADGQGTCATKDFVQVLNCLGEKLALSDIKQLLAIENLEHADTLRFEEFCQIFSRLNN